MASLLIECDRCHAPKAKNAFFPTNNPFFPTKLLNICRECVCKMLGEHPNDLMFADKLCQWADIPFDPDEWIKLYETNIDNTFAIYHALYKSESQSTVGWLEMNKKWEKAFKEGSLEREIKFFDKERLLQLKIKWGYNYDDSQLQYLEQLYEGILQSQNVNGVLQVDQALKICKISLIIDEKIREGAPFKDFLETYDKLVKISDFTPKNAKNANNFDSAGEIFAYLEKTGWMNKYYDGVSRDIVDKTMKNIQAWLRNLYINETGISDDIEHKIEALKIAKQLEDQADQDIEEVDKYGDEAYDIDDIDLEFEADLEGGL